MTVKYFSSPFPTSILPRPDGTIDSEDRALLAVGYPLAAVVPTPPPAPPAEREPTVVGIPPIRWQPQIYTEEFLIILPPLWAFVDDRVLIWGEGALFAGTKALTSVVIDCQSSVEWLYSKGYSLLSIAEEIAYPLAISGGLKTKTICEDGLKFGDRRKQLIVEYDKLLGIEQ